MVLMNGHRRHAGGPLSIRQSSIQIATWEPCHVLSRSGRSCRRHQISRIWPRPLRAPRRSGRGFQSPRDARCRVRHIPQGVIERRTGGSEVARRRFMNGTNSTVAWYRKRALRPHTGVGKREEPLAPDGKQTIRKKADAISPGGAGWLLLRRQARIRPRIHIAADNA